MLLRLACLLLLQYPHSLFALPDAVALANATSTFSNSTSSSVTLLPSSTPSTSLKTSDSLSDTATSADLLIGNQSQRNGSARTTSTSASPANGTLSRQNSSSATITGISAALSCQEARSKWFDNDSGEYTVDYNTSAYYTTVTDTATRWNRYTTTWTYLSNTTAYTLCDGLPRLDGSTSTSTWANSTGYPYTFVQHTTAVSTSTETLKPFPTCAIDSGDCSTLNSAYSSSSSAYMAARSKTMSSSNVVVGDAGAPIQATATAARLKQRATITSSASLEFPTWGPPLCGNVTIPQQLTSVGAPACAEAQASVNLLYWPVARAPGNVCHANASITTMSETIPGKANTIVTLNTTLTSPTNYIQLIGTWGYTSGGTNYAQQTRLLFPRQPDAISSYCANFQGGHGPPQSINYADFNYPVPARAYTCQPKCFSRSISSDWATTTLSQPDTVYGSETYCGVTKTFPNFNYETLPPENLCSTIWDDYAPALSVPDELHSLTLVSQFAPGIDCTFLVQDDNLFFDPPTALVPAASAAPLTTPNQGFQATTTSKGAVVEPTPAPTASSSKPLATGSPSASADAEPAHVSSSHSVDSKTSSAFPSDPEGASSSSAPQDSSRSASLKSENDPVSSTANVAPGTGQSSAGAASPSSHSTTTTTSQAGIGDIIASVIGVTTTPATQPATSAAFDPSSTDPAPSEAQPATTGAAGGGKVASTAPASQNTAAGAGDPAQSSGSSPAESSISRAAFTFASTTLIADPSSGGVAGSSVTLVPGGPAVTISGTTLSLATSASFLVVDGSTQSALAAATQAQSSTPPVFTFAGQTLTVDGSSALPVGSGVALVPGGSAITVSGTVLSLASSASYIVVDGAIQTPVNERSSTTPVLSLGGQFFTAETGATAFNLGNGPTLTPGGVATLSGHTVSLASGASYAVVDGSSTQVLTGSGSTAADGDPRLTLGGTTLTANSQSAFTLGSGTVLRPGAVVTVSGTTISLDSQASKVVINGVTQTLARATNSAIDPASANTASPTQTLPSVVTVADQSPSTSALPTSGLGLHCGTNVIWAAIGLAVALGLH